MIKLKAHIIEQTPVNPGNFLTVHNVMVEEQTHRGAVQRRPLQCLERGDGVAVLFYDPAADVVLLANEMRVGMLVRGDDPYRNALCAGGIKTGEDILDVVVREAEEEMGIRLRQRPLLIFNQLYPSAGGCSERLSIAYAEVDSAQAGGVHGLASEHESILTIKLSFDEYWQQVQDGTINTMKTVLAAYWLKDNRARLRAGISAQK